MMKSYGRQQFEIKENSYPTGNGQTGIKNRRSELSKSYEIYYQRFFIIEKSHWDWGEGNNIRKNYDKPHGGEVGFSNKKKAPIIVYECSLIVFV